MQKGKWLSEEALQIAVKRREAKGKGEREKYTHLYQSLVLPETLLWCGLEERRFKQRYICSSWWLYFYPPDLTFLTWANGLMLPMHSNDA